MPVRLRLRPPSARVLPALAALGLAAAPQAAHAADPEACAEVRMADPGWTDITSTNAVLGRVLEGLGYEQEVTTLAVPVVFESLKNNDLDAFLGNWMPAQEPFIEPLTREGAIEVVRPNLQGAKFTLAVPDYVAQGGVASFADLAAHADRFERKIYGIEPGAPANQNIQRMLDARDFGLDGWQLVDSSEQAMLAEVERAKAEGRWIVFLAWEPHPMNTQYRPTYLSGGDEYFGANFGGTTINTVARKGYAEACPNIGRLLKQTAFSVPMENTIMTAILDEGEDPEAAAEDWLKANPTAIEPWLAGVQTLDGEPGLPAVKEELGIE